MRKLRGLYAIFKKMVGADTSIAKWPLEIEKNVLKKSMIY